MKTAAWGICLALAALALWAMLITTAAAGWRALDRLLALGR